MESITWGPRSKVYIHDHDHRYFINIRMLITLRVYSTYMQNDSFSGGTREKTVHKPFLKGTIHRTVLSNIEKETDTRQFDKTMYLYSTPQVAICYFLTLKVESCKMLTSSLKHFRQGN